ncbi:MAG: hypothetical protein ABUL62_21515 [Myxococcales bacterium]
MRDFRRWGHSPRVTALMIVGMTKLAAAQSTPPSPPAAAPQPAPAPAAPAQSAAQPVAPAAPPPGYPYQYPPPPPGYPYQYPPPPGYAYPAYPYQARRPPDTVPYQGGAIPPGYHLEERPKKGLIISGALLTGVPWAIGLAGVSSANFPNSSGWLVVPALGPWLTLAARHDSTCKYEGDSDVCFDDGLNALARTALVFDGLVQTAGAVLFIVGISSKNQVLARDFTGHLHLTPAPIGRNGTGAFLSGDF